MNDLTKSLDIFLNKTFVGVLTKLTNGRCIFAFDERYIADPQRPILSQSDYAPDKELITKTKGYNAKLPPFFSNLLPEGSLREYIAEANGIKPSSEFDLLACLGADLPGAVIAKPSTHIINPSLEKNNDLNTESKNHETTTLRFSLAGVQLKLSALIKKQGGATIPASGIGGDWILKLPSPVYDHVPENEYAMMHMASKIGIPLPEIKLMPLSDIEGLPNFGKLRGTQALAVKRFDRNANAQRTHIEDFAQVYHIFSDKKYEGVSFNNMLSMIWDLTGEIGLSDFVQRLVYMILIGNGDMHLKNWSLIYKDPQKAQLSPAYDLLSTVPYLPQDGLALKLGKTKNMAACTLKTFEMLSEKLELPKAFVLNAVTETVEKTIAHWHENKNHYALPLNIQKAIDAHMKYMPLFKLNHQQL